MKTTLRSLAYAAVAFVAVAATTPVFAVPLPNPADFSVTELPGIYTVTNNSSTWYIWAFGVSNPNAVGNATATTSFSNWIGLVTQLDFGQGAPVPTFAYGTQDANLADINNPSLLSANIHLSNYIGPNSSSSLFFFTPATVASDFGFLLVDANDDFSQVNGSSTTPLPAALPLFATGLGALGLLARRRKRKAALAA